MCKVYYFLKPMGQYVALAYSLLLVTYSRYLRISRSINVVKGEDHQFLL
jgi:hypothetical protein